MTTRRAGNGKGKSKGKSKGKGKGRSRSNGKSIPFKALLNQSFPKA